VSIRKLENGRWEARVRAGGRGSRRASRTFDRKRDAERWEERMRRQRQLGAPLDEQDITLAEFIEDYWRLHAIPNLRPSTRDSYLSLWHVHVHDRLGERELRTITPKVLNRFRADLERAGVGTASVVKGMALVQSILSFAVVEERVEFNAMAVVRKPTYERAREPHIFLPIDVEELRAKLNPLGAMLVSLLAYSGARPEEVLRLLWRGVGSGALLFDGQKTRRQRHTPLLAPLADDLRAWRLASGVGLRPHAPVIPAHDGRCWEPDDWRNWRRRVWGHWSRDKHGQRVWTAGQKKAPRAPAAPPDTRPRDLRSSYITVQIYAGVPLTTIAKQAGTSVAMIDKHYAGVIANWDGRPVPAEVQITRAREQLGGTGGRSVDVRDRRGT
jgi:integrase